MSKSFSDVYTVQTAAIEKLTLQRDALLAAFERMTNDFNMTRLLMPDEARALAGEMVVDARALIAKVRHG